MTKHDDRPFIEVSSSLSVLMDAADALAKAQEEVDEAAVTARRDGVSWELIGVALGMSRQAAHKRYARSV